MEQEKRGAGRCAGCDPIESRCAGDRLARRDDRASAERSAGGFRCRGAGCSSGCIGRCAVDAARPRSTSSSRSTTPPTISTRCVDSVLAHTTGDYRLVLIDDASPDPAVARLLRASSSAPAAAGLLLLANESNLGFTLTANRGMSAARAGADVVLLNSDTVVTRGWLDALARCAASDPAIGTVTPFSNNAEICSLPRFCENNPLAGIARHRADGARRSSGPPCRRIPICRPASASASTSAGR